MTKKSESYVAPKISTLKGAEIVESLGPVSAGSGGGLLSDGGRKDGGL